MRFWWLSTVLVCVTITASLAGLHGVPLRVMIAVAALSLLAVAIGWITHRNHGSEHSRELKQ